MTFQPGQSGNSAGRPRGSASPEVLARRLIFPHVQSLVEKSLASALQGDANAATALLSFYSSTRSRKKAA